MHHPALWGEPGIGEGPMNLPDEVGESLDDQIPRVAAPEPLLEDQLTEDDEMTTVAAQIDDRNWSLVEMFEQPPIVRRKEHVPKAGDLPLVPQHERTVGHAEQRARRNAGQTTIEKPSREHGTDSSRPIGRGVR